MNLLFITFNVFEANDQEDEYYKTSRIVNNQYPSIDTLGRIIIS